MKRLWQAARPRGGAGLLLPWCVMVPGVWSRALAQSAPPALSRPLPLESVISPAPSSSSETQFQSPLSAGPGRRKRRLPLVGADLGSFFFLNSRTRRLLGGSGLSISPGLGGTGVDRRGNLDFDVDLLSNSNHRNNIINKFMVVFAGVQLARPWKTFEPRQAPPPVVLYYGAGIGAIYADLNVPEAGVKGAALGATGSVFVGVALRDRAFAEARLRAATRTKSLDFSGIALSLGVRF